MSSNEAGSQGDPQSAGAMIEQRTDEDYQAELNQVQDEPFPASRHEEGQEDAAPRGQDDSAGGGGSGGGSGVADLDSGGGD